MDNIKHFAAMIVIVSVFIQIGKTFLSNTQYEKLFKIISAFFIMIIIILMIFPNVNKVFITENQYFKNSFEQDETNIKSEFEKRLEQTIENDIHNKFYVNYNVEINTDFKSLKIYILKTGSSKEKDIAEYIKTTYCTPKDEVIMIGEFE
ncbi:MAG: hypothetical protein J6V03_02250 [Clostridia bacterium]|nr:hypothetical protein [Clostridia bacterium]